MTKSMTLSVVALLMSAALSFAQEEVVIEAFESSGEIKFATVSNALSYRVEWAPYPGGTWTNFAAASSSIDEIVFPGDGVVTAIVPMVYRVIATVTNPSAPAGMSLIPAGEFVMGDSLYEGPINEIPRHTVYISAFYMDRYEVTKALWDEVSNWAVTNDYSFGSAGPAKATNHPVHSVDWYDAIAWCNARSEREGLTPCYTNANGTAYKDSSGNNFGGSCNWSANGYRLPTEAEWEKAARGGLSGRRFPWGDTISHSNANYNSYWELGSPVFSFDVNPTEGYHPNFNSESPVGYFAPNGYGLYDMAGNAWEWCWDWYGSSYYSSSPSTDPRGPSSGDYGNRVLRGGAWVLDANDSRVAIRYYESAHNAHGFLGFRCARGGGDVRSLPVPQTITFDPIGNQVVTSVIEVVASANSGLPVSLTVLSGPAELSGSQLSFSGAGIVSIVASQAGNSYWQAAMPMTNTFQVTAAAQTITIDSIGDQVVTSVVKVVASASSGLPVLLTVLSGPAELSGSIVSFSGTGTVSIVASQAGNSSWQAAMPVTNTFEVISQTAPPSAPAGMSLIPSGEFVMGDTFGGERWADAELPLHTNYISAFYMDQYEVTKELWDEVKAFNGGNGYSYSNPGQGKATNHPVHTVNWYDVVKWCNARSEMEGLPPVYYTDAGFTNLYKTGEIAPFGNWSANGYRLPTEAEWEKAARGGIAGQRFPWGNTITHSYANYNASTNLYSYDLNPVEGFPHQAFNDGYYPISSPVGYFAPNGYGLYDMAGNAWEWCWDWYGSSYYSSSPSTDPRGPSGGEYSSRVLRGGAWAFGADETRNASRFGNYPGNEYNYFGFRCARGL